MQTKLSLLASALSLIWLVSAQDQLSAMESYVASATNNPAFISANGAVSDSPDVVASQARGYLNSVATATASVPLPPYVTNLPSSAQGPLSSYFVGAASIIASSGAASPTDSMTISGSAASNASSASANSTSASNSNSSSGSSSSGGSSTTSAPSKSSSSGSSGSTSATSSSASAKASNGAVAQHPGTFIAAAAGALGFAILL